MANIIEITDISAKELDPYARMTENQLKSRLKSDEAVFIAESRTVVTLALDNGYEPVSFLVEKAMLDTQAVGIIERCPDVPVYTADKSVLMGLTGFTLSRGIFALMKRPLPSAVGAVLKDARRVAVLEDIMDAINIGAIIRSAAALGIDAVLLTKKCCDPLNRRAARVSMGTVFQIPWAFIDDEQISASGGLPSFLCSLGFSSAAMALTEDSVTPLDERLKSEDKLALILGTEGTGLCESTVSTSDYVVKIPMFHGVDSLNVAAASAVIFWEISGKNRNN